VKREIIYLLLSRGIALKKHFSISSVQVILQPEVQRDYLQASTLFYRQRALFVHSDACRDEKAPHNDLCDSRICFLN